MGDRSVLTDRQKEVKFFISAIVDLHDLEVIGFVISAHPNADLIEKKVRMAMDQRKISDVKQVVLQSAWGSVSLPHGIIA